MRESKTTKERKAAIGFSYCGCPTFALVLGYGTRSADEKDIRQAIERGLDIKVMHPDEARKLPNFLNCPHNQRELLGRDMAAAEARRIVAEALGRRNDDG